MKFAPQKTTPQAVERGVTISEGILLAWLDLTCIELNSKLVHFSTHSLVGYLPLDRAHTEDRRLKEHTPSFWEASGKEERAVH